MSYIFNISCFIILTFFSLLNASANATHLIADLEVVAMLENGDDIVLGSIQIDKLPKEEQGFFKNRKHLKSQIATSQDQLRTFQNEAQARYGERVKLLIRGSLVNGELKEELFQLRPPAENLYGPSEEDGMQATVPALTNSNGDLNEKVYLLAKKVSKGFNHVDIHHQFKPLQKWYAYLAAKLDIPVHDVFYGFTAATIIGMVLYQVNSNSLDALIEGGFKLSVSKEFAVGALTAWSSLFEASTVLFTSFYIHWVNNGNLFLNRMKISCLYLLVPVIFAFYIGLPMSDNANVIFNFFQQAFMTMGQYELNTSVAEVTARFLDGLWLAFIYVLPTHFVVKSLGKVKSKLLQSSGNLTAVLAANVAAHLGMSGSQNGYNLVDVEAWLNGKLSLQDLAISLSQHLPKWLAQAQVSPSTMVTGVLGIAGLFGYSGLLYSDWKIEQLENNPDSKPKLIGWFKSFFKKTHKKTTCKDGFL